MTHETLESRQVFDGKVIKVFVDRVLLPGGTQAEREVVRHPGAVGVVALVDGRFLMVRQHRHSVDRELLEIPAGKLDSGESPEACARRELREETGYSCNKLSLLTTFLTAVGFSDEWIHLYLTLDARAETPPPSDDDGEPISVDWLAPQDAKSAIWDGRLVDSKTIIGLLLALEEMDA